MGIVFYDQASFGARFEWGIEGVQRLRPLSGVLVIVDVLSFSTAVDVAVERGASVLPFQWCDERAVAYALDSGALLAGDKRHPTADHPYTLSPSSLLTIPDGTRIVLPSPNGSTLAHAATGFGSIVLAGCLRNASAVAGAARAAGGVVTVIAAGERWDPGDALRPAVEDLLGAGAILAALGATAPSPEARAAIAAFESASPDLAGMLQACASGRELIERGFGVDVQLAGDHNRSRAVPILRDGAFVEASP